MGRNSKTGAVTWVSGLVLTGMVGSLALLPGVAHADMVYNTSLAPPGVYFGSGNANSNFTVDDSNGVELGLSGIIRYSVGGPITPVGSPQNIYDAPIGATTSVGHTGSKWGFDFSIDVNSSGSTGLALADVTASLTLTDVKQSTTGSFNPLTIGDNATVGASAAQNSEALSYASIAGALGDPGFNLNAYDTYDFTLTVTCTNADACGSNLGDVLASDSMSVQTVPEPASLALLAFGLAGLGFVRYRNKATGTI